MQHNDDLENLGWTECHAMGDAQNCCIQPRLTAMEFSYILTLKGCMYALDNDVQKGTLV